eukprot:SAG11_NODE_37162_length_258_cov_0.647799_1_plen_41_part_01
MQGWSRQCGSVTRPLYINEIPSEPVWVEVFIPIFFFSGFYF